jgi:hypothetical protein
MAKRPNRAVLTVAPGGSSSLGVIPVSDGVADRSTCCTVGCQRRPAVVHSHAPGSEPVESERAAFCVPCRRAIEYAKGIPWGDTSDEWIDADGLNDYIDEESVRSERYVPGDSDE